MSHKDDAIRKKYQKWKPSMDELMATGQYHILKSSLPRYLKKRKVQAELLKLHLRQSK